MAKYRHQVLHRIHSASANWILTKFGTLRPNDQIQIGRISAKVITKKNRHEKINGQTQMELVVETPLGKQTLRVGREELVPIVKLVAESLPKKDPRRLEVPRAP